MCAATNHVRFTPESGHRPGGHSSRGLLQRASRCPAEPMVFSAIGIIVVGVFVRLVALQWEALPRFSEPQHIAEMIATSIEFALAADRLRDVIQTRSLDRAQFLVE